jgi:hypothetical protein
VCRPVGALPSWMVGLSGWSLDEMVA